MRESPEHGVFIKDIKKYTVTSDEEFEKYLKQGTQNRKTGKSLFKFR